MYAFDVSRPNSVDEAAKALASGGQALAGGQTLIPSLKQRLADPGSLVDLGGIDSLRGISASGDAVTVGAMTCHADVANSADVRKAIPALAQLAGGIGDVQVRNVGTLGGSIANNDPAADYPAGVLGLGATVVTNKREMSADDFFQGLFETALDDGEIITAVKFPVPKKAGYAKLEQRASRFCLVSVFVADTGSGVRVAVSGAGADGVFRCKELESALSGGLSADACSGVSVPAGGLLSDIHAQADYRAAVIPALAARAIANAG